LTALAAALEAARAAHEPTTNEPQHEEDDGEPGMLAGDRYPLVMSK